MAIPAKPVSRTFTQPDGSKVTIILSGDEHFSYYTTTDGVMLIKDQKGYFKYAVADFNNELTPGKFIACNPDERNAEVKTYLSEINNENLDKAIIKLRSGAPMNKISGPIGTSQFPNKGEVRGLIIMAEFKDQKFSETGTKEEFTRMMNEEGYSNYNATGSARDYFIAQSNKTFIPTFDVVGPVSLPQNMEFYGKHVGNTTDQNPAQMIVDACNQAKKEYGVDFSQYDFDNDGQVDLIYVIYAGYAESQGASTNTIWPHAWDITYGGKSLKLDGKSIRTYACSSELLETSGTIIDGIGSFCHEFSHCMGLPDLYDTQGRGGFGLGFWSIMDRGCYNNNSKTPPSYSAFERYSVSWMEPEYLTDPQKNITLEAIDSSNKAYFIKSDKNANEYYILENRQPNHWDKHLPSHGLMITHVNYNPYFWTNNTVNTPKGQERVQLVPADNVLDFETGEGDAFPGTARNNSFTDVSFPAASLSNGGYLGKPVTKITENDGIITFNFRDYLAVPPTLGATSNITDNGFTTEWSEVEGASSYVLEIAPKTVGQPVFSEDFSGFKAGDGNNADNTDISQNLDGFTKTAGWSGNKIYQAGEACMLGASSENGQLITSAIDLTGNESFTLCVELKSQEASSSTLQLNLMEKQVNSTSITGRSISISTEMQKIYWTFNASKQAEAYLKMTVSSKALIKSITIYTGNVKNELESNTLPPYNENEQKQIIPDITSTNHNVTGLKIGSAYYYCVSSLVGEEVSAPSKKNSISTTGTGIQSATRESRIFVSGNQLFVSSAEGETIEIYTVDGILKNTFKTDKETSSFQLENGIYIIRIGNKSYKATVLNK